MTVKDLIKILHPNLRVEIRGENYHTKIHMGYRYAHDVPIVYGDYEVDRIKLSTEPILDAKMRKKGDSPVLTIVIIPDDCSDSDICEDNEQ